MGRNLLATLVALSILTGCTVGPDHVPPSVTLPPQWSTPAGPGVQVLSAPAAGRRWWTLLGDPVLQRLVEQAMTLNNDLRLAEARLREARAQRGVVAADRYPSADAAGTLRRGRISENIGSSSGGQTQNLFQVGFDARWEFDLFGGTRRAVEAAEADIAAAQENWRDVLVTLQAEVARNYLEVRGSQQRIAIARENIAAQRDTVALTQGRVHAGIDNELQLAQAQAQLSSTEAQLPSLERSMTQAMHRLAILLAQEPGALRAALDAPGPIPQAPSHMLIGLPSELLQRRPDLRRAERELAAASARVGVATADLFPKFSLTAGLGQQALELSDLVDGGSGIWSFSPSLRWPVFDAGRIRAAIQVRDARHEAALVRYEQAVLGALEDVENALLAYDNELRSQRKLAEAVEASRRAVTIADELYQLGLVSFLNLLVGQRALYQSQDALVQSEQRIATAIVALFKALGGGWDQPTEQAAEQRRMDPRPPPA